MAAHLRPVPKPRCLRCDKPATEALYNTYNAHLGDYCARHATEALAHVAAREAT
jgi:hypothetical protein